MKTKKFEKKLELNQTTIADLDKGGLEQVKGGVGPESVYPDYRTCLCTWLWNETGCVN